ncbi:septum formation protein Maf [Patescibacteria group bacterium]|nr:septum formation protein Maf [Patescibacteria group bacterium]
MNLKNFKLILASQSPNRKKILDSLGIPFEVEISNYKEQKHDLPPNEYVLKNAEEKALEVSRRIQDRIIIGVDTIGAYLDFILEKPENPAESKKILKLLSDTTHEVYSGICIIDSSTGRKMTSVETTKVKFAKLSNEEMDFYINSGEGSDKAAGFAIQGLGALFIEKIEGDFYNVVGLPLFRLNKMLKTFGVDLLKLIEANRNLINR